MGAGKRKKEPHHQSHSGLTKNAGIRRLHQEEVDKKYTEAAQTLRNAYTDEQLESMTIEEIMKLKELKRTEWWQNNTGKKKPKSGLKKKLQEMISYAKALPKIKDEAKPSDCREGLAKAVVAAVITLALIYLNGGLF